MYSMVSGVQLNGNYINYNNNSHDMVSNIATWTGFINCAKNAILELNPFFGEGKSEQKCGTINESSSTIVIDLLKIKNIQKIDGISLLRNDWNGNGALPFNEALIKCFSNVINAVIKFVF
ncbi:MAG: hypothetical protein R3Y24_09415 [Eubacteriales bacterium]